MASCKLFNTAELLENILLHLPGKNVFGVIRVCKAWRNVINTSPTIQRALFLRPPAEDPGIWLLDTDHNKIRKVDGPCSPLNPEDTDIRRPIIINDIVMPIRQADTLLRIVDGPDADFYFKADLSRYTAESSAYFMFISSPPVEVAQLHRQTKSTMDMDPYEDEDDSYFTRIFKPRGITFGDILREYYSDPEPDLMSTRPNRLVIQAAIPAPADLVQHVNQQGTFQPSLIGRLFYDYFIRKQILAHLSPQELLPLRRVDDNFRDTIDDDLRIHMFRDPPAGTEGPPRRYALIDCQRGIVGLLRRDSMIHSAEAFLKATLGGRQRFLVREVYEINPILVRLDENSSGDVVSQAQQKFTELRLKVAIDKLSTDSYFRDMYVTRPAIPYLHILSGTSRIHIFGSDVATLAEFFQEPRPYAGIRIPSGVVPSDADWIAMAGRMNMTAEDVLSYIRSQGLRLNFDLPYMLTQHGWVRGT